MANFRPYITWSIINKSFFFFFLQENTGEHIFFFQSEYTLDRSNHNDWNINPFYTKRTQFFFAATLLSRSLTCCRHWPPSWSRPWRRTPQRLRRRRVRTWRASRTTWSFRWRCAGCPVTSSGCPSRSPGPRSTCDNCLVNNPLPPFHPVKISVMFLRWSTEYTYLHRLVWKNHSIFTS